MLVAGKLWEALVLAAVMFWQVAWSLVLGFAISGAVQTLVSNRRMRDLLGRDGLPQIALATVFGAASSSCSYASAAVTRSMFAKGAALVPSLAFLFASTNLVVELGIVLWLLTAWQFTAAEWLGGIVLIGVMTALIRLTYPASLVERARERATNAAPGMDHDMVVAGDTLWKRVRDPQFPIVLAQHFVMDWSMLWVDLLLGFAIAGALAAWVPADVWHSVFLPHAPQWARAVGGAFIGPLVAMVTFVCSIGNVPMAAILWSNGMSFGGVLAFLYADLIVLPLLDVYRKYYGLEMAAYIGAIFYATIVISALVIDRLFSALGLVPAANPNVAAGLVHFSIDYTFWLNLLFGGLAVWFIYLNWRYPMDHGHHCGHDHEVGGGEHLASAVGD